jgi:hypothetical protein
VFEFYDPLGSGDVIWVSSYNLSFDPNHTERHGLFGIDFVNPSHNCDPCDDQNRSGVQTIGVAAVPEPSTWAMMVLGFAGVGFMA